MMNIESHVGENQGVYDVVGVGFGPSNLSVAIALREASENINAIFLEAKPTFQWHPGMLIDDATMQVSFLKDLANFRNPQSEFTFVSYLHSKGRLQDFVNLGTFYPSRLEFHDYFAWCAQKFAGVIQYDTRVTDISLTHDSVTAQPLYRVKVTQAGRSQEYLAKTVLYSAGLMPSFPEGIGESKQVIHTQQFMTWLNNNDLTPEATFTVVGGGQSAVEVASYLANRDSVKKVISVVPRFGFMPADDSPFVNQIFDPEHVDTFFHGSAEGRKRLLELHAGTNYAAVDIDDIKGIYWQWYQSRVRGESKIQLKRLSYLESVSYLGDALQLSLTNILDGTTETVPTDYLICATGFKPNNPLQLFSDSLKSKVTINDDGYPQLGRDYRIESSGEALPAFYATGISEPLHGLTSTLISNMAVRAGEIAASICACVSEQEVKKYDVA